jgi:hypothetical protein
MAPPLPLLYSDGMQTILRTVEFLCLSLWLGADAFLSFAVAPGAFAVLADRDAAGLVVGYSLSRMHAGGMILGILFLVIRSMRTRGFASLVAPAALCVALMILLTAVSQFTVSHRMASLRREMVSVQNTPATDPRRVEFNKLHQTSVMYEGAVLLLGFAAMFLLVRETAAPR